MPSSRAGARHADRVPTASSQVLAVELREARSNGAVSEPSGAAQAEALEAETRELDDEIESLEAQLEVKVAIIADSSKALSESSVLPSGGSTPRGEGTPRRGDAILDAEPRVLVERLFERRGGRDSSHHIAIT